MISRLAAGDDVLSLGLASAMLIGTCRILVPVGDQLASGGLRNSACAGSLDRIVRSEASLLALARNVWRGVGTGQVRPIDGPVGMPRLWA